MTKAKHVSSDGRVVAADYMVWGLNPTKEPMEHASISQSDMWQKINMKFGVL